MPGDDLVLTYNAEKVRPDQDLLLHLVPSTAPPATRVAMKALSLAERLLHAEYELLVLARNPVQPAIGAASAYGS